MNEGLIGAQIIGIVIAGIIAVIIGKDASERDMNGIGWGLFTFLICIIALPIYLVVRKPRSDEGD
ncbi:MAG: hypothetical protein QOD42_2499 [Sphingomonadales bacterium]|jgi:MFS family permease|nr:hypothetical protein [Sphingomonadales bacterium]